MNKSRIKLLVLITTFVLIFSSCGAALSPSGDILTQKKTADGKIPITISLKYSIYLDEFEKAAQARFPELDLIQVGNYTSNYSDEYAQQLANDDLTDIVITWPLDLAARSCEDKLIDLSGEEFTSRYNLSILNGISNNGKLYYLPGPTQLRGILYNKTLFEEKGWEVPTDFDGFINLCAEIENSGIRALQLSFWNKEVLQYAFTGFGYCNSFSSTSNIQKIQDYQKGKGSLGDFALPAFESFEKMIDAGIFKAEDLEVRYPIREKMFAERQCAMIGDSLTLTSKLQKLGSTDEFALMPFFSPGERNAWGHLILAQYIGLNQNLTKPENKEKYELALKLMDFISSAEGQLALTNGDISMVSSLSNSAMPYIPELANMQKSIQSGQYAVFPTITYDETTFYDTLSSIIKGEITSEKAIEIIDIANKNPTPLKKSPIIGTATRTFSLLDTGNYVTDTMRSNAKTDIALFLDNGKDGSYNARGISSKLYKGNILESDITKRVLPVLQHGEKGLMNIATIKGENLLKALEYTLEGGEWFYYFSGLKMDYDPTAPAGSRIKKISDDKGKPIEPNTIYSVAIMEGTVAQEYIETLQATEILIKDLIIEDIKTKGNITPASDARFTF